MSVIMLRNLSDLDHLRPFGCLAMMHIPEAHRGKESKFTLRAHDAIFMEHVSSSSWKVYNLVRKCFEVSHNVTFFVTCFPSGKAFPHLRSADFRGDMLRAMDNFVVPLVVAHEAPPVA